MLLDEIVTMIGADDRLVDPRVGELREKDPTLVDTLTNVTPQREAVLADLQARFPAADVIAALAERERANPY